MECLVCIFSLKIEIWYCILEWSVEIIEVFQLQEKVI